jgi:hypothetical protein
MRTYYEHIGNKEEKQKITPSTPFRQVIFGVLQFGWGGINLCRQGIR